EALVGPGAVESVLEPVRELLAVGRHPLHVPVDAGEPGGPHHAAVTESVLVAVLELCGGLAPLVVHERDLCVVAAERRARHAEAPRCGLEGEAHAVAPGPLVAG